MITASQVKELREKTGAGMMDCKKALTECDGDMAKAVDWLREKGISKAAKKEGRIAAEGLTRVATKGNTGILFEVNSETDFVAKNEQFLHLLDVIQNAILDTKAADVDAVLTTSTPEGTIADLITNATATIGEKITFRRVSVVEKADDEFFGSYMHMGGKISALVVLKGETNETVAKNIAMQVASMAPTYVSQSDIPGDVVEHERELQLQMMKADPKMAGKPEKVLQGILKGKVDKHFKDQCLLDQEFFLDPKMKVANFLKDNKVELVSFVRFQTGEGIEKREENFAEEVMSQIKG
ncbi:translation elongation factor Ts [Faecalitalea cylindroides]|uniref:translation elongation factor Ts n=1 Tax=Faecalitalea cylindroides TaxID=39483 RepID=UPI000B391DA2|nr:translation elongation factor Ts [Faecalitalea cylindroides]MDB7952439.1 translation elongation factor Ts [Faecalitalea cylindroides]MDB7959155.1 translation elongation factor Ts [Faecalitalea cylindroides]MDB7960891.1 translation elongation factor Ts [Faecalitalea cylindroides]MDB7963084.1 translation elongation factor Ts [Faecalitalea cylindroides]MDB7964869.1 translation elongation factor Ts [Faecalitalea cylindroides]